MRSLLLRLVGATVLCSVLAGLVLFVATPRAPAASASRVGANAPVLEVTLYVQPTRPPTAAVLPTQLPATAAPTATPLPPVAGPTPIPQSDLPLYSKISGWKFERQAFNNCGPAALSMYLNLLGNKSDQYSIAGALRPTKDDRNVTPDEMAAYAARLGYRTFHGTGGDLMMLRQFAANGIPVLAEMWFEPEPGDEMGHYAVVMGHGPNEIVTYDSFRGPNSTRPPPEFDALWRVFNRAYVVIWKPEQESVVRGILGDRVNPAVMAARTLELARAEVKLYPQDKFSWFNLGTSALDAGDIALANEAFDKARELKLPWRMLWYQYGPYAAYLQSKRYDEIIALTNQTLARADNLEENYYWRGLAYLGKGEADKGRADLQRALQLRPDYTEAKKALGQ